MLNVLLILSLFTCITIINVILVNFDNLIQNVICAIRKKKGEYTGKRLEGVRWLETQNMPTMYQKSK